MNAHTYRRRAEEEEEEKEEEDSRRRLSACSQHPPCLVVVRVVGGSGAEAHAELLFVAGRAVVALKLAGQVAPLQLPVPPLMGCRILLTTSTNAS